MATKISLRFLWLGTVLLLALVACSPEERSDLSSVSLTATPDPTVAPLPTSTPVAERSTPTPVPTPVPTRTSRPTESPESAALDPCVIGEWRLVDSSAYMVTAMEAADIEIEYQFSSGKAFYVFSTDGSFLVEADQYTENFVLKFRSGGVMVDVPISTFMDGFSMGRYSTSDGKITFSGVSNDSMVFQATVFEETQDMEMWAVDSSGEVTFLYECVGGDTLHLTPPINDYAVFPVILQRNR